MSKFACVAIGVCLLSLTLVASAPAQANPLVLAEPTEGYQVFLPFISRGFAGSVDIERDIYAGTPNSTIIIGVNFTAPLATHMRYVAYASCASGVPTNPQAWLPFAAHKDYSYTVPYNWSTFSIAVQYQSAEGSLSAVYCDEAAVEGWPGQ